MRIFCATGLLLILTLTLAGCSARRPVKLAPPKTVDALAQWQTAVTKAISDDPIFPFPNPLPTPPPPASNRTADENSKLKRDLAIAYTESAVMSHYAAVRQALTTGRALTAIAFETLSLAATTTVPIINGARGKTILGALATGLTGTHLSIDKNLFRSQTTGAILSAMDTCIHRQHRVLKKKRTLPAEEYLLYDAYVDLVNLFGCTTLEGAIQELGETQGAAAVAERRVVSKVTVEERDLLEALTKGFAEALTLKRADAVAFLKAMNVVGTLSVSSSNDELIGAYRSLQEPSLTSDDARAKLFREAKKAGILKD